MDQNKSQSNSMAHCPFPINCEYVIAWQNYCFERLRTLRIVSSWSVEL